MILFVLIQHLIRLFYVVLTDNLFTEKEANSELEDLKSRMVKCPADFVLKQHSKNGFAFGPQFNLITEVWSKSNEVLAKISPTQEIINEATSYVVHPSIIDACIQTSLLLKHTEEKFVPYKIEGVTMIRKVEYTNALYCYAKVLKMNEEAKYKITLYDVYARPVMIIDGFIAVQITADRTKLEFEKASFTMLWSQEELAMKSKSGGDQKSWLVLRDRNGYAEQFCKNLSNSERATFVDMQDNIEETRHAFAQSLDEVLKSKRQRDKLTVVNFWPSETSQMTLESKNFMYAHNLAFESCLVVSQEIMKKEPLCENVQLVFVTSAVVSMSGSAETQTHDNPATFPWSASVLGFRRTFSDEVRVPNARLIDLSKTPNDNEFLSMIQDLEQGTTEEEIAYRNGLRYVNRLVKLSPKRSKHTKQESPFNGNAQRKPFKLSFVSHNMYLRTASEISIKEKLLVDVHFASPVFHKNWKEIKMTDSVAIAGKLCRRSDETEENRLMIGVCKAGELGSYVAVDGHCFMDIPDNFSPQQAASLCYPMAMTYHILKNLLTDVQEKKILIHHYSEEISCIMAFVAMAFGANVVCLVKNRSSKDRVKKCGIPNVISEDEVLNGDVKCESYQNLDNVCFLSRNNGYVSRQVLKNLKSGATVIITYDKERTKVDTLTTKEDVKFIATNLDNFPQSSDIFFNTLIPCCSVLKSSGILKNLLEIPLQYASIYDAVVSTSEILVEGTAQVKSHVCLNAISLKPENVPKIMPFYRLPLDSNGFKEDRTYLVVGGVRGFGFEVAKWMVENGAKTVVCTARSAPTEEKKAEVQRLEKETGSCILLRQADATSWKDMNVIKKELDSLPPPAGIVFSAMVLEDQLIKDADVDTCRRVVGTKVQGNDQDPRYSHISNQRFLFCN